MKITEITRGAQKFHVVVNNEEIEVLNEFKKTPQIYKSEMTERQQVIANQLVNKDLLIRINENNRIIYKKPGR
jgi:hypothetical protein